MISNQILFNTIQGLKNITKYEIDVISSDGKVVATTIEENSNIEITEVEYFIRSQAENQLVQGHQYFKVFDNNVCEYVIRIKGDDEESYKIGKLASFQIQTLIVAYKEKFDKDNFIKNLLLDNLLLVDIYTRAKKLEIKNDVYRIVYVIQCDNTDVNGFNILRKIFPEKSTDFIASIDQNSIVLVKELDEEYKKDDIINYANMIVDTYNTELMEKCYVAIGSPVSDLKNVSASFKEAKMALEVGQIFSTNKYIANYEELGMGRLICQLPISLCELFVEEVLKGMSISEIDSEMLITIDKFFENSLNVSETSRQLYIHRNTLVYRLDKLLKSTGLDLRKFDDAIIFKITLMVDKYMEYRKAYPY